MTQKWYYYDNCGHFPCSVSSDAPVSYFLSSFPVLGWGKYNQELMSVVECELSCWCFVQAISLSPFSIPGKQVCVPGEEKETTEPMSQ